MTRLIDDLLDAASIEAGHLSKGSTFFFSLPVAPGETGREVTRA